MANNHKRNYYDYHIRLIIWSILSSFTLTRIGATSINYGISQQPITDISQLLPKLCQNQSVICEGSLCIPGVKRCVCDIRMPVQVGRFCLRQIDIETKCFATSQCNHTIKDAVCIDQNSNAVLDTESSIFKLEQWQQLNDLRRMSQPSTNTDDQSTTTTSTTATPPPQRPMFLAEGNADELTFEARDDVIMSSLRNSPYEINYSPELKQQNHTRRRTNTERNFDPYNFIPTTTTINYNSFRNLADGTQNDALSTGDSVSNTQVNSRSFEVTTVANNNQETSTADNRLDLTGYSQITTTTTTTSTTSIPITTTTTSSSSSTNESGPKRKVIVKTPNYVPGLCLCPHGFMFDPMLRKCLALSLADSHCTIDNDCRQISKTHCSMETKKCDCIEPLVWNQTLLACVRPKPAPKVTNTNVGDQGGQPTTQTRGETGGGGLFDNLLTPPSLVFAKLVPDQTVILLIIIIVVIIIISLVVLRLTLQCFSSRGSVLVSPTTKHHKNRNKQQAGGNNLPPKSPYATLKRPENHGKSSDLSNFTQATRGRILNYDFEQDAPIATGDQHNGPSQSVSPQPVAAAAAATAVAQQKDDQLGGGGGGGTLGRASGTLLKNKAHRHAGNSQGGKQGGPELGGDQMLDLNDDVSLNGQPESESKSDNSVLTIPPGPPASQPPPYMLAGSAMMGQGSAIAAAAAAVANRRMQMASQKKNNHENNHHNHNHHHPHNHSHQQQQQQHKLSDRLANGGSPVFL